MKKRVIGMMLVTSMLCAGLISGCGNQQGASSSDVTTTEVSGETSKTTETQPEEPKELSVLSEVNAFVENIETNEFTIWYEEYSGIHVNWEIAEDPKQAFSLKVVGDDLPDVLYGANVSPAERDLYGIDGVFIDLTDLIEEHAPNIKRMFEENPDWRSAMTSPDGAIYGIPYLNSTDLAKYPNVLWVYKPWLDALNVTPESIKTTDDLYELFKKVAETDLNGNGKKDEIPYASRGMKNQYGMLYYLMNNFVNTGNSWMYLEDGKLVFAPATEEWREGLRYINKLYSEGLILPDSISLDRTTLTSLGESDPPVLFSSVGMWSPYFTTNGGERSTEFVALPPVKNPSGYTGTVPTNTVNGTSVMHVTSSCEDPVTAIKWLDGLLDEEPAIRAGGNSSVILAQEGQIAINGEQALYMTPISASDAAPNTTWGSFYMGFRDPEADFHTYFESEITHTVAKARMEAQELYAPFSVGESVFNMIKLDDANESSEYGEILAAANNHVLSHAASFISGEKSLDKDWDQYIKELENYGLARLLELAEKGVVVYK